MDAPDLIFQLRNAGYTVQGDGEYLNIRPGDDFPSEWLQQIKQHKAEILAILALEQRQEVRRGKVLAMLEANPELQRAVYTDCHSDPERIIITMAIRHTATCEMKLPKSSYQPWQLLMLVDTHAGGDVH
jgi:hypothetical protein